MNWKRDLWAGSVFAAFDGLYLYFCGDIEPFTGKGTAPLTNRFMPYLLGGCMMLLSVLLILRALKQMKRERAASTAKQTGEASAKDKDWLAPLFENGEVIASFLTLFLYILLMEKIGFVIMTAVFLTVEISILTPKENRKYGLAGIIGVILSVILYFVFGKTLHILLPPGIFHF